MALFDFLTQPVIRNGQHGFQANEQQSVCNHLNELLNARRGVLKHLSDYGLPDVEDIYEGLPYSQHTLAFEVKKLIEKYEPRVRYANVVPVEIKEDNCVIRLDIQAFLTNGQSIKLNTRFESGGKADVVQRAKNKD
ncbi:MULTISPECIES: type VI secretion system baseplate subunit TssE [unclassified Pseudoalteromonas]|uniref:type VI secretion system baseplate subunit TssE n=1 Tax=unclassified Pseudoalteromonas TaxID=194690 RepID=UPI002359AFBF|nr:MULTISPECIES: type VI secretion system baseplate subunit TssE [unclassified Pseudoalteromonas]MDC9501608.1 type VI secretion system baseplate subunit TssE [Pseudoalteromonas sp. Angola-18]MDC9530714.1 type VI secretion system baseplate subunit TssE [Pseudoalteromonas sp. Angola-7]